MRLSQSLSTVAAATLMATGLALSGAAPASADPLPGQLFAPYFEAWNGDSPAALSSQSGAKDLTLAFLQTPAAGSCEVDWNGDSTTPVSPAVYGDDIRAMRARGGDVIPSFGGYAADHDGTELADGCTDVNQIAAAYEHVITTYGVTRLDLDTEDNSLSNTAGIDRRNKAIKLVEDWAARTGRIVRFSYTLPTTATGLAASGLAVLQNAVSNGARIDVVNIMTFDYWIGTTQDMAADTVSAANGLHDQLAALYPHRSSAQLWRTVGVTEMIGIDDFGSAETFTTADATSVRDWAAGKGIGELSFWALQRDNGGCVGTAGSNTCSGIAQDTWYFTKKFASFARRGY